MLQENHFFKTLLILVALMWASAASVALAEEMNNTGWEVFFPLGERKLALAERKLDRIRQEKMPYAQRNTTLKLRAALFQLRGANTQVVFWGNIEVDDYDLINMVIGHASKQPVDVLSLLLRKQDLKSQRLKKVIQHLKDFQESEADKSKQCRNKSRLESLKETLQLWQTFSTRILALDINDDISDYNRQTILKVAFHTLISNGRWDTIIDFYPEIQQTGLTDEVLSYLPEKPSDKVSTMKLRGVNGAIIQFE